MSKCDLSIPDKTCGRERICYIRLGRLKCDDEADLYNRLGT